LWPRILASALGETLVIRHRAELGPAFGAARLGRIAVTREAVEQVCAAPEVVRRIEPDEPLAERYRGRIAQYRDLYSRLRTAFGPES
jgi:xylulokinase